MNFPKNFVELMPYILFVIALEIFYWHMLRKHIEEVRKLRDEKAALLEILLAFLKYQAGIQPKKARRV